jgi:dTDP-4-dehydrorhamnose 3,5-epimerase-like enzyme
MSNIKKESAKKLITKGLEGEENGWLSEMFKGEDGEKTEVYLTVTLPGAFKGYHFHKVRMSRFFCLKGKVKITTYEREGDKWVKSENILDGENPERLIIPAGIATGIDNIGDNEAWLVNYPNPPYDPNLLDEQIEYTKEELEGGVVK